MKIRVIAIVLDTTALCAALIWLYKEKALEPLVTSITLFSALLVLLFTGGDKGGGKNIFSQKSGKNSKSYQSGGDMHIN